MTPASPEPAGPAGSRQPPPPSLGPQDDALLLDLARKLEARRLTAPAVLWLESLRPLSFVGSQAMHFLNPFVQMLVPSQTFARLAEILEERPHLERLLQHLEAVAGGADRPAAGEPR